jgi:hypothetical protein
MATREPWEYEGVASQTTAELPCACGCGCHTSWAAANPAQGASHWPAQHYPVPTQQPAADTRPGVATTAWLQRAKSISATVLAMLIVATVGASAAHNAGAIASRIVPIMHDQPFYFDPLAVVHDVEKVINS